MRWYGVASRIADNVSRGAHAVLAIQSEVQGELPVAPWATVTALPTLALATWQAFALADRTVGTQQQPFGEQRKAVMHDRKKLFSAADFLVTEGFAAADAVAKIREGTGPIDAAEDVFALVKLVGSMSPKAPKLVDANGLAAAHQRAEAFLARLRPQGRLGATGKTGEAAAAADLRDRVFTLLLQAHEQAWRIGAWHWGKNVGDHVPALTDRRV